MEIKSFEEFVNTSNQWHYDMDGVFMVCVHDLDDLLEDYNTHLIECSNKSL
jgi:hypothetical protein